MAKQKEKTELTHTNGNTALAQPSQFNRPWQMEGEDAGDLLMPRIIVHQGDISEKFYGKHPKGTLLDSTTQEPIEARRFVPITAFKEWIRFGEGRGARMIYKTREKSQVPAEDLEWNGDEPPAAQLTRNFVVLFDGHDMPLCLSLKESSKAQRNAGKMLNQMEKMRAGYKRGPGLYELDIIDQENDQGKWKDLRIRPMGNPSDELAQKATALYEAFSGRTIQVQDVGEEHEPAAVEFAAAPTVAATANKPYDPNDD